MAYINGKIVFSGIYAGKFIPMRVNVLMPCYLADIKKISLFELKGKKLSDMKQKEVVKW